MVDPILSSCLAPRMICTLAGVAICTVISSGRKEGDNKTGFVIKKYSCCCHIAAVPVDIRRWA